MVNKFIDWLFKTKDDKIVIGQRPNASLILFGAFWLLAAFIETQPYNNLLSVGAKVALLFWSSLELRSGVNRFRRLLGLFIFSITLINLLSLLF